MTMSTPTMTTTTTMLIAMMETVVAILIMTPFSNALWAAQLACDYADKHIL